MPVVEFFAYLDLDPKFLVSGWALSKIKTMPVHLITLRALEKSLDIIS
jgi:hypothetical protein